MGRRQTLKFWNRLLFYTLFASWAVLLTGTALITLLPEGSFPAYILTVPLYTTPVLTIAAVFAVAYNHTTKSAVEDPRHLPLIRVFALLIPLALLAAVWFSIQSLWVSPFDETRNRFVLENLATGAIFVASILTLTLTSLQRDIYWMTGRAAGLLDERQIKERQAVFERSYKFGFGLTVLVVWGYLIKLESLGKIRELNGFNSIPGHYYYPAICLVIALVALPLIVAAWGKRPKFLAREKRSNG